MARAIWSGSVSFGLVNVPVRVMAATVDKDIHFHQVDEKSGDRLRHRRVSERTGREVPSERIANGFEVSSGHWVVLSSEELGAAEPERTHTIDIEDFVKLDEIDPLQFERSYWLTPTDQEGAKRSYALLRTAMERTGRVAIGRFVMRSRERLVAVRPLQGALALHTMLFGDELVKASKVEGLPVRVKAGDREVAAAVTLIDSLATDWDPSAYRDRHRDRVRKLIDQKAKGEEIVVEASPEPAAVLDLMAALEQSVAEAKAGRGRSKAKSRGKRKSA
jgi:DNA end-binding protein Ku